MADRVGQHLGNYQLIKQLGEGGFAEVYLGEHIHLGSHAAIKVLHSQLTSDDVEKFRNEARTIVRLVHPHIVRLLEFGIEGKTPFLVMDYAPNGTLRQRHPRGVPLPLTTVVSYVKSLADALQFAHDEKLIHRDIKPENMLLGRRNEILLSDFGIAIVAQSSRYQGTQDMAGTIAYMAPEQIQAHPRPASDQYSLAIVVYEWLTGERPFHGSFTEIAIKHSVVPPPPLREKLPTISPVIEQVVLTALAKDPKERFGSVQAFANALEQASQPNVPTFVKPVVPIVQATHIETPPPTQVAKPGTIVYTYRGHSDTVNTVAWSPDGSFIASGSSDETVHVWDAVTGDLFLTYSGHSKTVTTLAWSPDGMKIASGSLDGPVHVWGVGNGGRFLTYRGHCYFRSRETVWAVVWSPDGKYIISGSDDNTIQLWYASTGKKVFTYRGHSAWVNTVSWAPDDVYIASGGEDGTVQVWENDTGRQIVMYTGHSGPVNIAAWSPDGEYIASGSDDGIVQVWEGTTGREIVTYDGHSDIVGTVMWSPDGRYIASGSDDGLVQVWEGTTGHKVVTYNNHSGSVYELAWSPDGKYIVSAGTDKTVQVWVAP
ncbi:MAG: protein kinase domain-containing protein [Ktedonobacteraceae bacterium]